METKKIISLILILVILGGVGFGSWWFVNKSAKEKSGDLKKETITEKVTKPVGKEGVSAASPKSRKIDLPNRPKTEKTASFSLQADSESYSVGENFTVSVMVNGMGEVVDGVEFVLTYDNSLVEISEPVVGSFFSLYPQKTVDSEKGTVRVIALQPPDENKNLNEDLVVTLGVTALQKGTVELDFDKEKTHIAGYGGQELLEETEGLEIVVE